VTITNNVAPNNGRLFWKPLLPANRIIVEVGGPNSSGAYVERDEPRVRETPTASRTSHSATTALRWRSGWVSTRLELQPAAKTSTYDVFLNVLEATTTAQGAISATTLVNGTKTVGAAIGQRIAIFNRFEGYISRTRSQCRPRGNYKVLFCDLQPGMVYSVNGVQCDRHGAGSAYASVSLSGANSPLQITATGHGSQPRNRRHRPACGIVAR
jgi:hypothetical protein